MMEAYSYFEKDGAYFRRRNGLGLFGVSDVLSSQDRQWKPFRGDDPLAPVMFGNRVDDPLKEGSP